MAQTRDARERDGRRRATAHFKRELRRAERSWLSRQLHDDVGPSLCAAGLQLSLLRTETAGFEPERAAALENVQTILERTVDLVRLLSYTVDPGAAARCGLRDMVRMMARSFRAEVPEAEKAPRARGAAAVELAEQLLDCFLLLDSAGVDRHPRVWMLEESVELELAGRGHEAISEVTRRPLRHWRCELREKARPNRTNVAWSLDQAGEK